MKKIETKNLKLWYGKFQALKSVNSAFTANRITAIIGPSGCGKSTLLRVFNRMNDLIEGIRTEGEVVIDNENILDSKTDLVVLRKKVGMVFQRPNPFPLSIYENIVFGEKIHVDHVSKESLDEIVERSLKDVLLWDELKDRLKEPALRLSLEQKQRLCIARLIAVKPDVLLMDEPCSTLDPQSTSRVEELMRELKNKYTIIIVTHNMQQAARVSDDTGFMLLGELIEFGQTHNIFTAPKDKRTEDYITGRYG
ncbi:MAG: phosphate ABC transporter ATP-binding protein [Omnitrophica WOR_2 bacterium GWF2_38_59]|nr:MAG: phosphate ABC transporter ATP-binding protein [Omnitrophica WOR_2 bacterium GWF2_38_59]OGX48336.1 MAG: phosphate ABC transporter ATP-binding protein [Omnitrophica WOR_2 bacterium RIFOXYA2_FULL_38_17]OGX53150.1 MAG: phosphate ABC transporter ATP-binding protein [Omnitrophica WOR_2 bacterium RIFOXYA12_FULL_38_10]OGX58064.1 MAG: phosphate ABC transporter ATP-binding protein [Omnitrophica WOR_2 bacterium RIFOXYB2_FULL_38_16]HBG61754.1 phosphate ABC transporter ATP-binding protein [Candidatu